MYMYILLDCLKEDMKYKNSKMVLKSCEIKQTRWGKYCCSTILLTAGHAHQ